MDELEQLTGYVCCAGFKDRWPAFGRKNKFWKDISEFLFVNMEAVRTGKLLLDVRIIK